MSRLLPEIGPMAPAFLRHTVGEFLAENDPSAMHRIEFLRARFDAGLAWVHFPIGLGGLGLEMSWQSEMDRCFADVGSPENRAHGSAIGFGGAASAILAFGTAEQRSRFLRPLWTGEESWCELLGEPGTSSDFAGGSPRALRHGTGWVVNGEILAHGVSSARFAILRAHTDPDLPERFSFTCFLCDLNDPRSDVRPLRQNTDEADLDVVSFANVPVADGQRLGEIGQGWEVANATLASERTSIGK